MADLATFLQNFTTAVDFQNPVDITGATRLDSLAEWDSLAALGVIIMFDAEYGLTITGNDLRTCASIEDIHNLTQKAK